jgi:nucleoside-diphosphate-sugar epimerase
MMDGISISSCDLTDLPQVLALFEKIRPDYVFHLSSLADGRLDRTLVVPTLQNETVASVNVLSAVSEFATERLLMPASLEEPVAGQVPSSPYAAAKAASHLYARTFYRLYRTPVVMARIFMAYGPGQPAWKLIPATVARLLRGEAPVVESPERRVDWIYIADVVDGLIATMASPRTAGHLVDIGSGRLTAIREVVERLRALISPTTIPVYGGGPARGNEQVPEADLVATERLTGWSPQGGLETGLERTVAALRHTKVS